MLLLIKMYFIQPPRKRVTTTAAPKKKSRIKLAQDLSISPEEEAEIRSAFEYFVDKDELGPDIIETKDLRKAFR